MSGILDIAKLTRYAKDYQNTLRTLPYFTIMEFAKAMKLNVVEVQNEDVIINTRRNAGNTGPYKIGQTISYPNEIGKLIEMSLKPELTVSRLKDNILNYRDKKILSNAGEPVDLTTKRHPLEKLFVDSHIISHAEDVVFSAFFADRNEEVFSPLTSFTGFFPLIDYFKTTSDISLANHNMVHTGVFGSGDGIDDYERLIDFLRSAHPMLKRSAVLCYSSSLENICKEALRKKVNSFARPTSDDFWQSVKDDAKFPGLVPVTHEAYGTGSALILVRPGMMDFGVNTQKASTFVQIRQIFEDPNEIQFWLEAAYGVRFQDIHEKVFQVNECTNEGVDLAGDYVSGAAVTVTLTGLDDISAGAWRIGDNGAWMASGKTVLGVKAGNAVIQFKPVTGYTTPANNTLAVTDGKDFTATGTYVKS